MTGFDGLTTPRSAGDGRFTIDVPDGWQQGRGAFGGLVLAILTRAAEAAVADPDRPLRSLTAEIVGPVQPGPTELAAEVLRAGTGVTTVACRLLQGGEVQAHAVGAFGKARATYAAPPALAPPDLSRSWREITPVPVGPPMAPVFARHVEFRFLSQGDTVEGWVSLREPGAARDAAYIVALADCWWPALINPTTATARPVATLTFALERLAGLDGLDPGAPLRYRARILAGGDGYAVEQRELWGEDGRLVALNQQTIVIMK